MGEFKNVKDLQTDKRLEQEGVELDFGGGRFITIARAGGSNRKYAATISRLHEPHKAALRYGSIDEDVAIDLMHTVFAEAVVVGWRGWIDDQTDQEMEFTVENVKKLFRVLPEVYHEVRDKSDEFKTFALKEVEDSGN